MEVDAIFKIAGIGLLVTITHQILSRSGREEQATLVSVAGIILVLFMLVGEIENLFSLLRSVFGL